MKTAVISRKIITLEEVAELTKYSFKYLNNNYMKILGDRGVRVLRIAPNAKPRFYECEILNLMEAPK